MPPLLLVSLGVRGHRIHKAVRIYAKESRDKNKQPNVEHLLLTNLIFLKTKYRQFLPALEVRTELVTRILFNQYKFLFNFYYLF